MVLNKLTKRRTRIVGEIIRPYLNAGDQILDFGCGSMLIPTYLADKLTVGFTGVDVIDFPTGDHDFQQLKPDAALPFENERFDVSIGCFALHHTNDPDFFFDELVRVTKKRTILLEDTFTNWVGKIRTKLIDRIYNSDLLINHLGGSDMNIPYNFKSVKQWKTLIAETT